MQGREIPYLDIYSGNCEGRDLIILMCRQHPPEVTGYFAFQSFIKTLLDSNSLAIAFRKKYRVLAFPLMNPDGVELGHWRHNAGGVDLNRDWGYYRQPETNNISAFIVETARALKNKVILGIDFHSTWHDVYYVNPQDSETLPDFWNYWTEAIDYALPEYEPRIEDAVETRDVTKNWFFREFGAEGITFEIGDNTDRRFIREKGHAAAASMMQLLIYK
jgi:murein tripeptide amidase MpaA